MTRKVINQGACVTILVNWKNLIDWIVKCFSFVKASYHIMVDIEQRIFSSSDDALLVRVKPSRKNRFFDGICI